MSLLLYLYLIAGAALVNFSEDCPKNILTQYLNAIMAKLEAILSTKFKEVNVVLFGLDLISKMYECYISVFVSFTAVIST